MGDKVRVDPADQAGVHVCDLKELVDLRVTGTTSSIDDLSHPPIAIAPLPGLEVVPHDHRHPWSDIQKDRPVLCFVLGWPVAPVVD
ncbi:MAG: hypothetical protein AAEC03_05245 [Synechococcus sp.]|tara:strand:+ start:356 stop:613 length:258 start_codon:yes stop_codon:yes gene_type:complete